jgi:hypothetical protein
MDRTDKFTGCAVLGVLLLVVFFFCGGFAFSVVTGGIEYSEGHRDGHVQKLSHRGMIWKNYEGQLVLPGIQLQSKDGATTMGNIWSFTADNQETAAAIDSFTPDDLVRLYYHQLIYYPPWKGSTGYIVYKVEKLK